jgi:hypothetical protein
VPPWETIAGAQPQLVSVVVVAGVPACRSFFSDNRHGGLLLRGKRMFQDLRSGTQICSLQVF